MIKILNRIKWYEFVVICIFIIPLYMYAELWIAGQLQLVIYPNRLIEEQDVGLFFAIIHGFFFFGIPLLLIASKIYAFIIRKRQK